MLPLSLRSAELGLTASVALSLTRIVLPATTVKLDLAHLLPALRDSTVLDVRRDTSSVKTEPSAPRRAPQKSLALLVCTDQAELIIGASRLVADLAAAVFTLLNLF